MKSQQNHDAAAVRMFPPAVPLLTILAGVGLDRLWPIPLHVHLPAPDIFYNQESSGHSMPSPQKLTVWSSMSDHSLGHAQGIDVACRSIQQK